MQPFQDKHGMRACMVAPTKIIAGLGMSLGIDRLEAPGTTGQLGRPVSIHSVSGTHVPSAAMFCTLG